MHSIPVCALYKCRRRVDVLPPKLLMFYRYLAAIFTTKRLLIFVPLEILKFFRDLLVHKATNLVNQRQKAIPVAQQQLLFVRQHRLHSSDGWETPIHSISIQCREKLWKTYYFSTHGCDNFTLLPSPLLVDGPAGLFPPTLPVFKNACIFNS